MSATLATAFGVPVRVALVAADVPYSPPPPSASIPER
jgi:hypothetical protein